MKILVIGGTGIIGGSIVKAALKNGDEVVSISQSGMKKRNKKGTENCTDIILNWYDSNQSKKYIEDKLFDVVIDCVVFNATQLKYSTAILTGHCKQYVFVSSISVNKHKLNLTEDEIDKETKWKYALDKLECESWLKCNQLPFSWTVIRPGVIYDETRIPYSVVGRVNQWTLVNRILQDKPILGCTDCDVLHPVLHADDFGDRVYTLLLNDAAYSEAFTIASDKGEKWDDVILQIEKALHKKAKIVHVPNELFDKYYPLLYPELKYDKTKPSTVDTTKLGAIAKIDSPSISLEAGVSASTEFLRANYAQKPLDRYYDMCSDLILFKCNGRKLICEKEQAIAKEYITSISIKEICTARWYILLHNPNSFLQKIKKRLSNIKHLIKNI